MDPLTKTYVSIGLVVLAFFEFWTAMWVFGRKQRSSQAKLVLRLHRILGYTFVVYFIWISWICLDLMQRLAMAGKPLDIRGFYHGFLAIAIFFILLLKISFIRLYRNYRPYVPLLGIIVVIGTLTIWGIAGWMFLFLLA